ncbi:hypothetical protein GPJ56_003153 [Histomonas meleagridis]|uniref:uncharacterized protein n=1 Tax=Histomonas meleagridis TaxID=135588 RepID=UPI003559F0B0|nr:hypothetical protein GPJ56_003153 [Histomonas meleagridis]KAH0801186.1 hypothetical protein GO595_005781 [Histomonas meleagridis]
MALFCPAFTHFAVQRIDLFINVAVPQLKIPNVLHPSTVMWGSKIVLKVMEVINDHNPLNPFIECIVVKFTGIVKDAPENEAVVRKMKVIVAELCKYLTNNLIICECLSMCLRSDDSKVLTSTMKTIEVKGIDVIAMIWPILVSKKETQFVERLATMLHGIYEKNGRNCDVFRVLPQNEKYTVDMLQKQFETAVAAKKQRRALRNFIMSF